MILNFGQFFSFSPPFFCPFFLVRQNLHSCFPDKFFPIKNIILYVDQNQSLGTSAVII